MTTLSTAGTIALCHPPDTILKLCSVGSYGWPGFYGTAWYNDPAEDMTTILIMQRAHAGDQRLPRSHDFWTAVYQAVGLTAGAQTAKSGGVSARAARRPAGVREVTAGRWGRLGG
jgi:CubicO group peptidase (beta-lactamase class C family)